MKRVSEAAYEVLPLMVGGDGALAGRLGLDHVDGVSRVAYRGSTRAGRCRVRIVFDHVHLSEPEWAAALLAAARMRRRNAVLWKLQEILGDARLNETAVVWLTRGAVSTGPDEGVSGLSRAPLWGLVRSARAEHPDRRLQLVDVDVPLARGCDVAVEAYCRRHQSPELALRHGVAVAPRRWCVPERRCGRTTRRLAAGGTVLIKGGAGETGNGRKVARHLVAKQGVRHLLR